MGRLGGESFRSRLVRATVGPECRPHRVAGMVMGIAVLSAGDLYMTLLHLTNFGMLEANPLARGIIAHGSPAGLALWKVSTVGLAIGILLFARRRPSAEIGAVFCCVVLSWLSFRWVAYSEQVAGITDEMQSLVHTGDEPRFVTLAPGGG